MIGLIYFLVISVGLVLGSFYNVLVYRLPGDMDLKGERSMCPQCKTVLTLLDLIPLVSWLSLGGKCRYCKAQISIQYPIVEATSALFALFAYYRYGFGLEAVLNYVFMSACLIIALTDIRARIIPDEITITIFTLFLIAAPFRGSIEQPFALSLRMNPQISLLLNAILGAIICGGFLLLLAELSNGRMGGGDIKFVAATGAFLGWYQTVIVLLIGSILGLIVTYILIKLGKASKGQPVPFGPYLAVAAIIVSNIPINAIIFPH